MFLKSLEIDGFKNLERQKINFSPKTGVNILLGQNGQGKTNTLEAIRFLALPKPLRSRRLNDCIKENGNYFRVIGELEESVNDKIEFGFQSSPARRMYKLDEGETDIKEFLGKLHVVLFTPDDLNLLTGAPSLRRRFLDTLLSQLYPEYYEAFSQYYHILKQRNALLKQLYNSRSMHPHLEIWNEQLVGKMTIIIEKRLEFMAQCNDLLTDIYQDLASTLTNISLEYNWGIDPENWSQADLKQALNKHLDEDIRYGYTGFGPHRDDFSVLINNKPAKVIASRGELRSIVLALKLIELKFFITKANSLPILLLDDVFSELDEQRREKLLEQAVQHQTFITTVEKNYFSNTNISTNIYEVDAGKISTNVV